MFILRSLVTLIPLLLLLAIPSSFVLILYYPNWFSDPGPGKVDVGIFIALIFASLSCVVLAGAILKGLGFVRD